jgi:hypothetical protein
MQLGVAGCATYSSGFVEVEQQLASQNPTEALKALEKMGHPERDRVLYLMNKAMLLRMVDNYAESNQAFEEAKRLIEERSAISIREQSTSLVINDATRSFIGEPFEQVMVHLYSALNYLELNQLDEARVEALQVDLRLRQLNKYGLTPTYEEDAFARYLSGIIFEMLGEWSDALIAYRKAYQAYTRQYDKFSVSVPESLQQALLRLTAYLGVNDELEKYKKAFSETSWQSVTDLRNSAELIVIFHNGLAPVKRESSQLLPNPGTGRLLRVSLPYYESRPKPIAKVRVEASGTRVTSEPVENVDAIARKTLEARMPAIVSRAIARMVIKDQTARAASKENDWAGVLTNVFNVMTERADTRSWLTLPAEIQLARFTVSPGQYTVKLEPVNFSGMPLGSKTFDAIKLAAGDKKVLSYWWLPHHIPNPRYKQ